MRLKVPAALDPGFYPMSVICREFKKACGDDGQDLIIGIERDAGLVSVYRTRIFRDGIGKDELNFEFAERIIKSLLWVYGGYRIIIAGNDRIGEKIKKIYAKGAEREFDSDLMSRVYEKPFEVVCVPLSEAPEARESAVSVGRNMDGCRIGFDAGGSDRKVSAVINGEAVFSEEVVWFPKEKSDPDYHYEGILNAFKTAASHMPRVDAIGVSSAGIYIGNRVSAASLFIKVSPEDFDKKVRTMYIDCAREIGPDVPLEVANDGDVTALAGAMELGDGCVLGCAMGTSQAGGYVDAQGNITGWLNELAFVPCDFSREAAVDEWSGDYGTGVNYFSQDAVIKLAPAAGIKLDESLSPADKLKAVQKLMEAGDKRAAKIYETIGVYFGYAVAYYAEFYDMRHVLVMGRVTSGEGGQILIDKANEVLESEFKELREKITLHIPDESSRRIGQSVAAASLPKIDKRR